MKEEKEKTAATNTLRSDNRFSQLRQGAYVDTPGGTGLVVYVRMAPPDFTVVEAVSVLLDAVKHQNPYYVGTIFLAKNVTVLKAAPEWL